MSQNLIQKIALASGLALSMAGCRTQVHVEPRPIIKEETPYYRNNLSNTGARTFGDKDFESRLPYVNFGYQGNHYAGRLDPLEDIVHVKGTENVEPSKFLDLWSTPIKTAVYDIDSQDNTTTITGQGSTVTGYAFHTRGFMQLSAPYKVKLPSEDERKGAGYVEKPRFLVQLREIGGKLYAYSEVIVDEDKRINALVPNPHRFILAPNEENPKAGEGIASVGGDIYLAVPIRVRRAALSFDQSNVDTSNLIRGKIVYQDIETEKVYSEEEVKNMKDHPTSAPSE